MCTQIQIRNGDGRDGVETCGQLWALVGRDNVVWGETGVGYTFEENECLCHVDVEATAERAGYECRSGWDEAACDYIWELRR